MKWMHTLTIVSSIQMEYVLDAFVQAAAKARAWSYSLIKAGVSEQSPQLASLEKQIQNI